MKFHRAPDPAILGPMPARNRRLPRHLSWPLATSDISDALGPRTAQIGRLWFNTDLNSDGYLLRVAWVPPPTSNYGVGTGMPGYMAGLQINVLPIRSAERAATRNTLRQEALPQLDAWITQALQAPETWLQTRHHRCWRVTDDRLTHQDE